VVPATFSAPEVDAPYVLNLGGSQRWRRLVTACTAGTVRTCSAPTSRARHLAPVNEVAIRAARWNRGCGSATAAALAHWPRARAGAPIPADHDARAACRTSARTSRRSARGGPITVRAVPPEEFRVVDRQLAARLDGDDGVVDLGSRCPGRGASAGRAPRGAGGRTAVGGRRRHGWQRRVGDGPGAIGRTVVAAHARPQPLYPLTLEVGEIELPLGESDSGRSPLDRTGAVSSCWSTACRSSAGVPCGCPPDVVSLAAAEDQVRASVTLRTTPR